jgi:hypothetical protein
MSKTFIAQLPNGEIAKRTSLNRTPTHAVVGRHNYERAVSRIPAAETYFEDFAFHAGIVEGRWPADWASKGIGKTPPTATDIAEAIRDLKGCTTKEEFAAMRRSEARAEIEKMKADGFYDRFEAITWCGSLALAQKAMDRFPWMTDMQIVAVTEKQPKQK